MLSQLCIAKLDHQQGENAQEVQVLEQVDKDSIMSHIILQIIRNTVMSMFS